MHPNISSMFSRELNNANSDVEAIIDEYDDFVFLNGNTCADALGI